MISIFHGDDEVKVHSALMREMTQAKEKNIQIVRLSAKGMTISDLETALGTQELFASEKLVIIDGLFSLPKSKNKEELLQWIGNRLQATEISLILVEGKVVTPTQLKGFQDANIQVFKLPMILFQFVENIGLIKPLQAITHFHQVLENQDAEFVFAMLIRQIRTLLAFVADGVYEGPPFGRSKIQKQARAFTIEQLLRMHADLSEVDFHQKTSRNSLTMTQEIDLFLATL